MVAITDTIHATLTEAQNDFDPVVAAVYYGSERLIPEFPSITVESSTFTRSLAGQGSTHKWAVDFTTIIHLFYGKVQSAVLNQREVELLAQQIRDKLDDDFYLNGLVVFGAVTRMEPIVLGTPEVMLRTIRITWEGTSRHLF